MPWILAGAALLGTALSSQQQGQSSAGGQRQQAIAGRQQQQPGGFSPTAQTSQASLQQAAPTEAMDMASGGAPPPGAQPPPQGGGSNTLGNINSAVQTGATLQQIFQGAQNQGANTRAQALAGRQAGPAAPYQPTAMSQMDPRLQQLLGR